jgi:hypothetical protein
LSEGRWMYFKKKFCVNSIHYFKLAAD